MGISEVLLVSSLIPIMYICNFFHESNSDGKFFSSRRQQLIYFAISRLFAILAIKYLRDSLHRIFQINFSDTHVLTRVSPKYFQPQIAAFLQEEVTNKTVGVFHYLSASRQEVNPDVFYQWRKPNLVIEDVPFIIQISSYKLFSVFDFFHYF